MADSEFPPRSTMTSLGEKLPWGTKASGTPSPLVSTAFAVRGSGRCTSLLKNCVWEPRSYLTPSSSTSVRSTKMIFAYRTDVEELGVKRSEEHTSELQSRPHLVCRLLLEKKKTIPSTTSFGTLDP